MPKKRNLPKGRKPTNEHQKRKYAEHYAKVRINKIRKHKNHIRIHPNDRQALLSLKKLLTTL
jgi:hypothetical protein